MRFENYNSMAEMKNPYPGEFDFFKLSQWYAITVLVEQRLRLTEHPFFPSQNP